MSQFNRAFRRRLKRNLQIPFTPSREFAEAYMEKLEKAGAVQRVQVAPEIPKATKRAFEGVDDAGE